MINAFFHIPVMKKAICKSNEKKVREEGEIESLWEIEAFCDQLPYLSHHWCVTHFYRIPIYHL